MDSGEGTNQVKPSPKACGLGPHTRTSLVSNDKTKKLSKVMSRRQRRASCGLGDHSASEAVQHSTQEVLGKSGFYKMLEGATQKQSMIG